MLSFFLRDVLDEIWDLIESVSGGGGGSFLLFNMQFFKVLNVDKEKTMLDVFANILVDDISLCFEIFR